MHQTLVPAGVNGSMTSSQFSFPFLSFCSWEFSPYKGNTDMDLNSPTFTSKWLKLQWEKRKFLPYSTIKRKWHHPIENWLTHYSWNISGQGNGGPPPPTCLEREWTLPTLTTQMGSSQNQIHEKFISLRQDWNLATTKTCPLQKINSKDIFGEWEGEWKNNEAEAVAQVVSALHKLT